jgi:hypothetical protein
MRLARHAVVVFLLFTSLSTAAFAQTVATPAVLTPAEMEAFLLNARIERLRSAGDGVTNSQRATLNDGRLTHDAHVQVVDEARAIFETARGTELNFKDTYRYNVAGYRLARVLGLDNVPMSVERRVEGKDAAVTWWIDNVAMDEGGRIKKQVTDPDPQRMAPNIHLMRVFDELIYNTDRNLGNLIWTSDWKMWMIDHTRAFRLAPELRNAARLERIDRVLLQNLRQLTFESVSQGVGTSLVKQEIDALLIRRDLIVKLFEAKIAQRGEAAILYTRR